MSRRRRRVARDVVFRTHEHGVHFPIADRRSRVMGTAARRVGDRRGVLDEQQSICVEHSRHPLSARHRGGRRDVESRSENVPGVRVERSRADARRLGERQGGWILVSRVDDGLDVVRKSGARRAKLIQCTAQTLFTDNSRSSRGAEVDA